MPRPGGQEGSPVSAGAKGISPEVRAWAEEQVGLLKPIKRNIVNIPTAITGVSLRIEKGTDVSGIALDQVETLDALGREATWIEQQHDERLPVVKEDIATFAGQLGVMGVHRDQDHGNFNVNAVPQRDVQFDDPEIKGSLTDEQASEVYVPRNQIILTFDGDLPTSTDHSLSPEAVLKILKHALLGVSVSEKFLDEGLIRRMEERRRNRELAQLILDGVDIKGIKLVMKPRVEIDDVNKQRPIKVRRPLRKRLILPRPSNK